MKCARRPTSTSAEYEDKGVADVSQQGPQTVRVATLGVGSLVEPAAQRARVAARDLSDAHIDVCRRTARIPRRGVRCDGRGGAADSTRIRPAAGPGAGPPYAQPLYTPTI